MLFQLVLNYLQVGSLLFQLLFNYLHVTGS
ncbi:hypothetical protein NC651_032829 [Populus alba x Populus x berolinensis]|nr:hypothetical protein NC651_032829 [Populus alba x Populus x berolinensis]